MNPNLPSSPIVSGALPLPAANPPASPEAALPNLAPPVAGVNTPPVFNQAPVNQLSPPFPANANQAPPNVALPPLVMPQIAEGLPAAPFQTGALPQAASGIPPAPQAIHPPALPAAPTQMVALPQTSPMSLPLAAAPPNTLGNIAPAPAMGNVLAPQPAQSHVAPPEEMMDRKIFTKPFVILLMVSSILILIAGLFFWSYIRTP